MSRTLRPAPPPLEANDQLVTAIITAAWAVALVVLLVLRDQIPPSERWWIWTCLTGVAMGIFGFWYVPRLKRARGMRSADPDPPGQSAPRDSGSNTVSSTETPGRSTRS